MLQPKLFKSFLIGYFQCPPCGKDFYLFLSFYDTQIQCFVTTASDWPCTFCVFDSHITTSCEQTHQYYLFSMFV